MTFVDTNYFLRFLIKDPKSDVQHKIAKNLFLQAARGKTDLSTSIVVIFEIYWVLTSFYAQKKNQVIEIMLKILKMNFEFAERDLIIEALATFKSTNLSLEDCYNLVFAKQKGIGEFKTFDRKLLRAFKS